MKKQRKRTPKSDHKHIYADILVSIPAYRINSKDVYTKYVRLTICTKCLKIDNYRTAEAITENGFRYYRCLNRDEILSTYPDLILLDFGGEPANIHALHQYLSKLDLVGKYRSMVRAALKDIDAVVPDETILDAFESNTKPEVLAKTLKSIA